MCNCSSSLNSLRCASGPSCRRRNLKSWKAIPPLSRYRYFAQAQPQWSVCRLSLVVCRAYRHALISMKARKGWGEGEGRGGAEGRRRTSGLNAWAIADSHKCRLQLWHVACLGTIKYECVYVWVRQWDAIFLLLEHVCILIFEAHIRGIQVGDGGMLELRDWVTSWWCWKWHKS